jgi:hypothetical protein
MWAVFGLVLSSLAASGAYIYAKRTRAAIRESIAIPALNYLGVFKWPSIALVTLVPAIAFLYW